MLSPFFCHFDIILWSLDLWVTKIDIGYFNSKSYGFNPLTPKIHYFDLTTSGYLDASSSLLPFGLVRVFYPIWPKSPLIMVHLTLWLALFNLCEDFALVSSHFEIVWIHFCSWFAKTASFSCGPQNFLIDSSLNKVPMTIKVKHPSTFLACF